MAVENRNKYVIPYSGLKTGIHFFEFSVDDTFFEEIEYSEIKRGELKVGVTLNKHESMLVFDFETEGKVQVECDRCLGLFYLPVSGKDRLIVKFGEVISEESDELIIIPESEHKFSLDKYIYEYISLMVPMQHIHPENENSGSSCDPEVVKLLEIHKAKESDPRWSALKNINLDNIK
jgi:uncharacterized protein